jgi:hypothetical protein
MTDRLWGAWEFTRALIEVLVQGVVVLLAVMMAVVLPGYFIVMAIIALIHGAIPV